MDQYKLQGLYVRLFKVNKSLQNFNLAEKNQVIETDIELTSKNSFMKWYKSVPNSLISEFYSDENEDSIIKDLKEKYAVPYLHLNNNHWALAIFSKNRVLQNRYLFLQNNRDTINKLARQVTIALKYIDPIDGELSKIQKKTLNEAMQFIGKNQSLVKQAEKIIEEKDKVFLDKNLKKDIWVNQKKLGKYFKQGEESNTFIKQIGYKCQPMLHDLELISIRKIQQKIKLVWQELKNISLKKSLQIQDNLGIQALFNDLPKQVINTVNQFENLEDIVNTADQDIKSRFNLTSSEIAQLKNKTKGIISSAEKEAYPHLDIDNLSPKEIEFLTLIDKYKNYPSTLDAEVGVIINQINNLDSKIDQIHELAETRRMANFLEDDKFNQWINLESQIYQKYIEISKAYSKIKAEQSYSKKSPHEIQQSYKNKSAEYIAIIEDVTGEKEDLSEGSYLPNFIIEQVNKTNVNLKDMKATLRPYQKFAAKYVLRFKHVLLGDQMGLGKTLESLAVANHLYQEGKTHIIVVSPFSVLTNWEREISDHTTLSVYQFHGVTGFRNFDQWEANGGILLTNYEQCQKIINFRPSLKSDLIIVDEAHNIKNQSAQRTIATKRLLKNSQYQLLMTGTPLENNLSEMNSLISILRPSLGKQLSYEKYLGKNRYKKNIASVYLRRKAKDVLKELPLVNMIQSWSKFNDEEQAYYDDAVSLGNSGFQKMRRAAFMGENSEKIAQIKHICEEARSNGEKVIVFSRFKEDVVYKLQRELPYVASKPITGDITSSKKRQAIIDEFSSSPNQSVLVCQIDAAGIGLNIQAASQVIICEPQMKPSTENQAISRAYRMGQTKNVTVYHMLTENSIDETMINKLNYKQKLFDKYANDSMVAELSQSTDDNKDQKQSALQNEIIKIEQKRLAARKQEKNE